ncbi:hypothetical protein ACRRTK_002124 [Alexandromys fortis]
MRLASTSFLEGGSAQLHQPLEPSHQGTFSLIVDFHRLPAKSLPRQMSKQMKFSPKHTDTPKTSKAKHQQQKNINQNIQTGLRTCSASVYGAGKC